MTCTTRPTFFFVDLPVPTCSVAIAVAISVSRYHCDCPLTLSLQRRRAAHDLRDLLGDLRLPLAIVGALQKLQDLACIVGGVLHGSAPGAVLTRRRLDQAAIHHVLHVERKQLLQNCLGTRRQDVIRHHRWLFLPGFPASPLPPRRRRCLPASPLPRHLLHGK